MKNQNLSRLAMAAVVCLTMVAVACLFQSLHGASQGPSVSERRKFYEEIAKKEKAAAEAQKTSTAKSARKGSQINQQPQTPTQTPATEEKETLADIVPEAPPLSAKDIKAYTPKPEQSAEERMEQLKKDIAEQKKSAKAAAVATEAIASALAHKAEASEEKKESKEEKQQAAAPITRNLCMFFDDGTDTSIECSGLATSFLQKCAFIIINQQLWQQFVKASAKKIFRPEEDDEEAIEIEEDEEDEEEDDEAVEALHHALGDKSCADIFFVPSEWDVYAVEGNDAQLKKQDTLYLFVPHQYKKMLLSSTSQEEVLAKAAGQKTPAVTDDERLGLNLSQLAPLKDPTNIAASKSADSNFREGTVIADALAKILLPYKKPSEEQSSVEVLWNIYLGGHGDEGDRDTGQIAGVAIPAFENIINFFDRNVRSNFFFYMTCFGGGEHLTIPFAIKGVPVSLSYPIAAGALLDTVTIGETGYLSTSDNVSRKNVLTMAALTKTLGNAVRFKTITNFETFFNGLDSFATGKSTNTDLICTLNAVGEFLTADLKKVKILENTPQIRFPGTQWFMVMRLAQELSLVHLTRAKIMAKSYDALRNNKPWKLDVTGNMVLLQSHDIALPLIVDAKTKLIPLIHAVSFLQQKPLILGNKTMPNLFAFTAPLIAKGGLFDILSSLWFLPRNVELTNIVLIIDTFICGNDFDESQQKTLSTATALKLEHVMIFLNTPNPLNPPLNPPMENAIFFRFNNNYYLLNMDKPTDQLSQIDEKTAKEYQTMYEQCEKRCVDERMEPLRAANEKTFGKKLISDALASIKSMKAALEAKRKDRLKEVAEAQEQLETARKTFLSSDGEKQSNARSSLLELLETHTNLALPVVIEVASTGMLTEDTQQNALLLFQMLFKKNQGVTLAINAASTGMRATSGLTQAYALQLFKTLLEKNQGFTQAINAASTGMRATDGLTQNYALQLFEALFKKNQGFAEAQAVINRINKDHPEDYSLVAARAKELQEALDQAQAEAKKSAQKPAEAKPSSTSSIAQ